VVDQVKVGIIGTGNIAPRYVEWGRKFEILDVVACADIDMERAAAFAEKHDLKAMTVDDLLKDSEIEIVVNLTIPAVHAEVSMNILDAGKHPYSEKPLGVTRKEGELIVAKAKEKGLLVGCAPDTFLGGGLQTCRKLIEDGAIGKPVAATAFMTSHGPERWHPNPDFFYQFGGGPMFDMGPYYLTTLINLMGPIKSISAVTRKSFEKRIATSELQNGRELPVEVPTHYSGTLDFVKGGVATVVISFDVWRANLPRVEIYGSEGSLSVPDPNTFGGPVKLHRAGEDGWTDIELTHSENVQRGIGVADLAYGIRTGRPVRPSGELALHVLDAMQTFGESSDAGKTIDLTSTVEQPAPLPLGLLEGQLDS